MQKLFRLVTACMLLALIAQSAQAVLTIKITRGIEGALPVAIVPFAWTDATGAPVPEDISGIIAADLERSGRFAPLPVADLPARPHDGGSINFRNWRLIGTEYVVVGKITRQPVQGYIIQFQVFDVFKGQQLAGYSMPANADELRYKAHQISDLIYEKLTGQRGAFTTRIAYVTVDGIRSGSPAYALKVADADGFDPTVIVDSRQPLMSPAWSPDGSRLAYVSFEGGHASVWIQDVTSGARQRIALPAGRGSAPAWSPDGRRLAMAIANQGNSDIYIVTPGGATPVRLTRNTAIDTEPAWSPDGKQIVFTSDRGGRPQIYQMSANGGAARRLTFEGEYNARPVFSPDGRQIAMVHGNGGKYRIAVLDVESGLLQVLTTGTLDESPSFAPNGAMIIYATQAAGGAELAAVSIDGRVRQRLALTGGDVREPAWSPFN